MGHRVCSGNPARTYTALLVLVSTDPVLHSSSACLLNPELSFGFCTRFWTHRCVGVAPTQTADRPSSVYTSDLKKPCKPVMSLEMQTILCL